MTNFPALPELPDAASIQQLSDDELSGLQQAISPLLEHDGDPLARAELLDLVATEMLRRHPDRSGWWYDRGMYAKWRGDWAGARDFNQHALDLLPEQARAGEAAAWNLGIAATALRDWASARAAWTAFGIPLPDGKPEEKIETDFGPAPVRLNAEPRFVGQQPVLIDGQVGTTEVVWGARLCPTRIRVLNVPTPESGHRFGDIVLHDGDTVGTRQLADGEELGVFNEIALWERSPLSTLTATVEANDPAAVQELAESLMRAGLMVEDWTANTVVLCKACSEGTPGPDHQHQQDTAWNPSRTLGLAGSLDAIRPVLDEWAARDSSRTHADLRVALP